MFLDQLLPAVLRPYAKAVMPALVIVCAAVIASIQNGAVDGPQLEVALVGLVAATITYLVPNLPAGAGRYLKALAPALLTLVALAVHALVTGGQDPAELRLALAGFGSAALAYLTPNTPAIAVDGPDSPGDPGPPLLATEDPDDLDRARALARLEHPPLTEVSR